MTHVLRRALRTERRAILGWLVGVVALGLVTTGSWPAVADSAPDLERLLGDLPTAFTALLGEGITSFSAAAVVGSRMFGSVGLVVMIGYAASRGARAIAGEEGDGTLELIVTQPISRTRVAVAKVVAVWLGSALLVVVQLVLLVAISPAVGLDFGAGTLLEASVGLLLLAGMAGMLAFAVGAATGSRGLAVAVAAGVAAALFLLAGFGPLVPALEGVARWSPFARYDGTVVLAEGVQAGTLVAFAAVSVVLAAAGVLAFQRRDLT